MKVKPILIAIFIMIASIIAGSFLFNKCTTNNTYNTESMADSIRLYKQLDSLQKIKYEKEISIFDSVLSVKKSMVSELSNKNQRLQNKLNIKIIEYKTDTVYRTPICDTIVSTCEELIESKDVLISYQDSIIDTTEKKFNLANLQIDKTTELLNRSNESLRVANLAAKRTWFEKNSKWLFLIGGAAGSYFLLK